MTKVFVYGTLKRGYGNNRLLSNGGAEFVCQAITKENFVLTNCGFPYMVPEHRTGDTVRPLKVLGEVYEVADEGVMSSLDQLEGVDYAHYQHYTLEVDGADGNTHTVLAYVPCNEVSALQLRLCDVVQIDGDYGVEEVYQWSR